MKLLFYINSLSSGGAERVLCKLANHFAALKHEVVIVTQVALDTDEYNTDAQVRRVSTNTGGLSHSPLHAFISNIKRVTRLRRLLKTELPDRVLAFMPTANAISLLAARATNTPVVVSERVHPAYLGLSWFRQWLLNRLYPKAEWLVVLSAHSAQWFRDTSAVTNIKVIPNSVALPLATNTPLISTDRLDPATPIVLCVGRLVEQKQPAVLMHMFAAGPHEQWHLVFIGSGELANSLKILATTLNIECRCHFIERVGNMQDWYRRAQIFATASKFEGSPNALLEAMACGCACIAFDCPTGPGEIIIDGDNGRLITLGDESAYAAALVELQANTAQREAFAQRAWQVTESHADPLFFDRWSQVLLGPITQLES